MIADQELLDRAKLLLPKLKNSRVLRSFIHVYLDAIELVTKAETSLKGFMATSDTAERNDDK